MACALHAAPVDEAAAHVPALGALNGVPEAAEAAEAAAAGDKKW